MDLGIILANIEVILKERGLSADKVSRASGHPDAIRNLRRAIERGKGGITTRVLGNLAKTLGVDPRALQTPINADLASVVGLDEVRLREFLIAQRDLIDRQIRMLDAKRAAPNSEPRRRRKGSRQTA